MFKYTTLANRVRTLEDKATEPVPCAPGPERPAFTTTDAVIALQIAVGSRPPDLQWDVSGDGSLTSLDVLMILQAAVGNIEIG